jgi:capsular polysaccharide biosynthesis protein
VELEAKGGGPNRSWTPVVPVPEETVAVAMFQWKRVPLSRGVLLRFAAYGAIIVVACTVLAYALSATSPAKYGARSELKYPIAKGVESSPFLREDRVLQTQLVALKNRQVLAPVAAKYNMTIDELSKEVSASVLDNSEYIRVQVNDHEPAKAQALVGAVVKEYIKQLPNDDLNEQATLNKRIASANAEIASLTRQLNDSGSSTGTATPAQVNLQDQISAMLDQRNSLQDKLDDAVVKAASEEHVQPITQPYLLEGKVSPKPLQAGIAGMLLGIMIACGVVFLLFRRMLKKMPLDQVD